MLFGGLGMPEVGVLMVLALFLFGPDRLPGIAVDAGKNLRKLRAYLKSLTEDLQSELGPEVGELDLRSLHPKEFVRRHLFEDEPEPIAVGPARRPVLGPGEPAPWDPDTT